MSTETFRYYVVYQFDGGNGCADVRRELPIVTYEDVISVRDLIQADRRMDGKPITVFDWKRVE